MRLLSQKLNLRPCPRRPSHWIYLHPLLLLLLLAASSHLLATVSADGPPAAAAPAAVVAPPASAGNYDEWDSSYANVKTIASMSLSSPSSPGPGVGPSIGRRPSSSGGGNIQHLHIHSLTRIDRLTVRHGDTQGHQSPPHTLHGQLDLWASNAM